MGNINHKRFFRILTRCDELGTAKDARPIVARVYGDVLLGPSEAYRNAHKAITAEESEAARESQEAAAALEAIDKPYREARALVLAYVPTLVLPDTLKRQPTDTDKVVAVEDLLDAIDDHIGKTWADEVLAGDFGTHAPKFIKEMREAIAANKSLSSAREARATAYGPAYEKYLAFKRVVREAHGPSSKQYQRIHLRSHASADEGGEGTPPPAGGTPPT